MAHLSADAAEVATAIVRGSFEYQARSARPLARLRAEEHGPSCASSSKRRSRELRMGDVSDFSNFMGAVIDGGCSRRRRKIDEARASAKAEIVAGGDYDDSEGYFVAPTVIQTEDPGYRTMNEEFLGPVVTAYVYEDKRWSDTLDLVDKGALRPHRRCSRRRPLRGRRGAPEARYAAGNFYVNDKPTGAVVGQQPFGGSRVGHERQGRLDVEPDPLGHAAHDQGDLRAADRLPLPLHGTTGRFHRSVQLDRMAQVLHVIRVFFEQPFLGRVHRALPCDRHAHPEDDVHEPRVAERNRGRIRTSRSAAADLRRVPRGRRHQRDRAGAPATPSASTSPTGP